MFLLVIEYLVVPQLAGTRHAVELLSGVRPGWVVAGVVLEALSLVCWSLLTRRLLPADRRPGFWWILRTDLTSLGLSHVTPAAAATGTAVRLALLGKGGTRTEDAVVGVGLEGVELALMLHGLLGVAVVASIPLAGLNVAHFLAAAWVAVLLGASLLLLHTARRDPARVPDLIHRLVRVVPRRWRSAAERALEAALGRLGHLIADRDVLRGSSIWAGNWLLDAAALWVFLAAFGYRANPAELLVAYGLANVLAGLPVSPGGLGIVEAVLISSLVGFGAPRGVATRCALLATRRVLGSGSRRRPKLRVPAGPGAAPRSRPPSRRARPPGSDPRRSPCVDGQRRVAIGSRSCPPGSPGVPGAQGETRRASVTRRALGVPEGFGLVAHCRVVSSRLFWDRGDDLTDRQSRRVASVPPPRAPPPARRPRLVSFGCPGGLRRRVLPQRRSDTPSRSARDPSRKRT